MLVSYKNLIRAIENVGIATSYVVQYYSIGKLNPDEIIQFLQAQVVAAEYLDQASNFSPKIRKALNDLKEQSYYSFVHKR